VKISLPLSIVFALLFFFGADWLCLHFFHNSDLTPVLRIFSLAIPFWVLAINFMSATIGFQDLRYRVYVNDLFQNIFKLIAIVALLALGFGVIGAAWGWVLAVIGMPFLAFFFLEKKVFPLFSSKVKAIPMERELFSFSWPLIFASVAGLITGWTDTLMLGYFSTATNVGIYNAALPTAQVLGVGSGAFAVIFMPVASELYARNRERDLRGIYSAVTKWILSIVLPGFLLMALFSHSVLRILFGSEFIIGASALSILAGSFFIRSLFGLSGALLQTYEKTKVLMVCSFCTAGANFILNFLLIPIYGINGAAIATGISVLLGSILGLFFVIRIAKMQPFRKSFFKPVIASLLSVSIVYGITKYLIGVSIPSLIGMLFAFLALYLFLLLLFKSFEPEDLMIMRAIDQRLGTKSNWLRKIIQRFL
jgi:O-antigen/teichoic acid export membrane protein